MQEKQKSKIKIKFWPSPQDYNEAVQNPHHNLTDPELQKGKVDLGPLGLPRPMTGAFASVYQMHCHKRDYAVRCFLREIPDTQWRYECISKFVQNDSLSYTVGFDFQPAGMTISGVPFPILKMEWVPGQTLDNFIREHREKLDLQFAERFKKMCLDLRDAGIAHGDLQHGNIMVRDDEFYLVDYDGMYVPAMKGSFANEIGHRNYQHPKRTPEHFGPYLDNFSSWVIYISLKALALDPSLYEALGAGEDCLLFRQEDFVDPTHSCAFKRMEEHEIEEIRQLTSFLRGLLAKSPDAVPDLGSEVICDEELPKIRDDVPSTRAEQASRAADEARQQQPVPVYHQPEAGRRRNSSTSFRTSSKAAPATAVAGQSQPQPQFLPDPVVMVAVPRPVWHRVSNGEILLGLFAAMAVFIFAQAAVFPQLIVVALIGVVYPVVRYFQLLEVRQLVTWGNASVAEVTDRRTVPNPTRSRIVDIVVTYNFTDSAGNLRTGEMLVDQAFDHLIKRGHKYTVIYDANFSVLYRFCGMSCSRSDRWSGWEMDNPRPSLQRHHAVAAVQTKTVTAKPPLVSLDDALDQLRQAVGKLGAHNASKIQPAPNVVPAPKPAPPVVNPAPPVVNPAPPVVNPAPPVVNPAPPVMSRTPPAPRPVPQAPKAPKAERPAPTSAPKPVPPASKPEPPAPKPEPPAPKPPDPQAEQEATKKLLETAERLQNLADNLRVQHQANVGKTQPVASTPVEPLPVIDVGLLKPVPREVELNALNPFILWNDLFEMNREREIIVNGNWATGKIIQKDAATEMVTYEFSDGQSTRQHTTRLRSAQFAAAQLDSEVTVVYLPNELPGVKNSVLYPFSWYKAR